MVTGSRWSASVRPYHLKGDQRHRWHSMIHCSHALLSNSLLSARERSPPLRLSSVDKAREQSLARSRENLSRELEEHQRRMHQSREEVLAQRIALNQVRQKLEAEEDAIRIQAETLTREKATVEAKLSKLLHPPPSYWKAKDLSDSMVHTPVSTFMRERMQSILRNAAEHTNCGGGPNMKQCRVTRVYTGWKT